MTGSEAIESETVRSYAAFLSYSLRYADWVETLHANLEATLARHGESRPIFLDRIDVAAGSSWVTQLAAGVDQAGKLVLVVTPEALASPRVGDEWQALVDSRRDWSRGQLVPVMLVWAPLPLFLGPIQYVDFRGHDEPGYIAALRQLAGALLELPPRRSRQLDLPADLTVPPAPVPMIPEARLRDLVARLAPVISDDGRRRDLASALGRAVAAPRDYGGVDSASSALVVETGERELVAALARLL